MRIKVIVADDQSVVRQGVAALLSSDPEIEVVATACNGEEIRELVMCYKPDVLLLDLLIPVTNSYQIISSIKSEFPETKVLILTDILQEETVSKSVQTGASGYLLKNIEADQLRQIVKATAAGQVIFAPEAAMMITGTAKKPVPVPVATSIPNSPENLTERETEVLGLMTQGKANKEIAYILGLSEKTIKFHVSIILAKLGTQSRTQAAVYALNQGLVQGNEQLEVKSA
jgi:DNA-binding NarL/FixJ family response regulator